MTFAHKLNGVMTLVMVLLWIGTGREVPMLLLFSALFGVMWLIGFTSLGSKKNDGP